MSRARPAPPEADELGYLKEPLRQGIRVHRNAALVQLNAEAPVEIRPGVLAEGPLTIGAYSYVSEGTRLSVPTTIGRFCSIAHNCDIGGIEHPTDRVTTHPMTWGRLPLEHWPAMAQARKVPHACDQSITIGHDVWIGTRAFIRNGISIGTGAVIGAHAVVTRDVPAYGVVAGNPGRVIRMRFPPAIVRRLLASRWWEMDVELLNRLPMEDVAAFLARIEEGSTILPGGR